MSHEDRVVADQRAAAEACWRSTIGDGAELPVVALHEEQQRGEERAGPGERRPCATSCAATGPTNAPDDRQHERADRWSRSWSGRRAASRRRGRARAGSTVLLQVVVGVDAAGGLAGDGDHVRREEHREHGRVERGVGPVVPVPGLLLLEPRRAGRGRRCSRSPLMSSSTVPPLAALDEHVPEYVGPVGHQAVDPHGRAASCISSGSSMVQTCTCIPAACARRTSAGVTTVSAPARGAGPGGRPAVPRVSQAGDAGAGSSRNAPPRAGDAEVATRPPVSARNARSRRRRERADQHPVRRPRARSMKSASERRTAASDLRSMLKRASGNASNSSASVGTGSRAADQGAPRPRRTSSVGDRARLVGDPVEDGVVEGQQHAVAGRRARRSRGSRSRGRRRAGTRPGCSRGPRSRGGRRRRGGRRPAPSRVVGTSSR